MIRNFFRRREVPYGFNPAVDKLAVEAGFESYQTKDEGVEYLATEDERELIAQSLNGAEVFRVHGSRFYPQEFRAFLTGDTMSAQDFIKFLKHLLNVAKQENVPSKFAASAVWLSILAAQNNRDYPNVGLPIYSFRECLHLVSKKNFTTREFADLMYWGLSVEDILGLDKEAPLTYVEELYSLHPKK